MTLVASVAPNREELIELLEKVVQVLSVEFGNTEGSGHDVLVNCRRQLNVLREASH